MKKRLIAIATSSVMSAFLAGSLSAATIAQRRENQQDRIAQGVKSGQLTAHETARLESKEAAVNHETRVDRAADGGKLTPREKRQVTRQQNNLSHRIYDDKHNRAAQ